MSGHRRADKWKERTALLFGEELVTEFAASRILVIGLGGVGAYAAELICRAGIGHLTVADGDIVECSNRNRQLPALKSTEGLKKADVMASRLRDINPEAEIVPITEFVREDLTRELMGQEFDYVVDAIDKLSQKVHIIAEAMRKGRKIVSSMGSGGKTDPSSVEICDIEETYNCPLARLVRKRLHRMGVNGGFKAVFSPEPVMQLEGTADMKREAGEPVGTVSYMPALFGVLCASEVIRELSRTKPGKLI